ncbi:putative 2-succinyl-6-hydroxy-2,4-cyclohexadiene-1-carboxylate synthase [Colletotrichum siamense]|nr:putative 2-succinyl-6-hydroxy-2,4-cyclohexadiene-1-carboxylate synthase [Colletotrichum siamense]
MSHSSEFLVLPRPGGATATSKTPIQGPSESAFTETFGALLPPVKFLKTATGKAAYYEMPPSSDSEGLSTPERVLFIHGVQTPALGMLPLARSLHGSFPRSHFVLVDLWGHGLSDTPVVPHEASLFHQLIDDLLDHLGWPSAHIVGFSFGASLTAGYTASRAARVQSFTLVAPAGLLHAANFTAEEQQYLSEDNSDEAGARKFVLGFLEGGELVVPADWKDRVAKGEVVAEAVREWQMREHLGHTASVIAIFRDGHVLDNDAAFAKAVETKIPSLAVLGGLDDLCSESQLTELGFTNVSVVPQVGHGVVRERVPEVAGLISEFWTKLG